MWLWNFADQSAGGPPPKVQAPGQPVGAEPIEEEQEEGGVGVEVNEVLENSLPWMTSILFHLALIILFLFIVFIVQGPKEEDESPIIPFAKLAEKPGGVVSENKDTELQATQNERKVESQDKATEDSLANTNNSAAEATVLTGAAAGGGGGKMAPFGTTTGTGLGGAKFYGFGGNATRIVFIVDASGSLIDSLPFVMMELKRTIGDLVPRQQFSVVFFQENRAIEAPPPGTLKDATPENKQRIFDWMDPKNGQVVPYGSSNPLAALRAGLRLKPQLVFILSDNITGTGKYEVDKKEIFEELDKLNKDRKIVINTIQFLYPDPLGTLEQIAKAHGGAYKFVKMSDLGLDANTR